VSLMMRARDDSEFPFRYAVSELQKDVDEAVQLLPESKREGSKPQFAVFAVHNKLKPKVGSLPADVPYVLWGNVQISVIEPASSQLLCG